MQRRLTDVFNLRLDSFNTTLTWSNTQLVFMRTLILSNVLSKKVETFTDVRYCKSFLLKAQLRVALEIQQYEV